MSDEPADVASRGPPAAFLEDEPTMPLRHRWSPGTVVAGRFRLVRPLGAGGMGAVWVAQHTELDTPCAVKFLHEEAARLPEVIARFKLEAKVAAQLRSPHVVQILDHGVYAGRPYIAMELLEGEDLAHRLKARGHLEHEAIVRMVAEIVRALSKAHAAGLVHRDLKPGNIYLVRDDDREITKILDFGIAKDARALGNGTTTGALLGTPYYMSPEQLRSLKTIDHRVDLWALAVVVYQCATGRLPFPAASLPDLVVRVMVDPRPVPSREAPELMLPATFDAWWARATHPDVDQRFQSAKEMAESLAATLGPGMSGRLMLSTIGDSEPMTAGGLALTVGFPAGASSPPAAPSPPPAVPMPTAAPEPRVAPSPRGSPRIPPLTADPRSAVRATQRLESPPAPVPRRNGVPVRFALVAFGAAVGGAFALVFVLLHPARVDVEAGRSPPGASAAIEDPLDGTAARVLAAQPPAPPSAAKADVPAATASVAVSATASGASGRPTLVAPLAAGSGHPRVLAPPASLRGERPHTPDHRGVTDF